MWTVSSQVKELQRKTWNELDTELNDNELEKCNINFEGWMKDIQVLAQGEYFSAAIFVLPPLVYCHLLNCCIALHSIAYSFIPKIIILTL